MAVPRFDSELQELLRKHQDNPKDILLISQLCYGANIRSYHGLCVELARKGLLLEPHHSDFYYELIIASSLDLSNTLGGILGELQSILEQRPKDLSTLTNLALVHYFLEQDEVAEEILSGIIEDLRADRRTYEILAQMEYARHNFEKCIEYCDKAIDQPGPSARMVRMKGLCFQELGELEQAQRSFIFCLELEPNFVWACHSLASLCMEQEDFAQAWQFFGKATYINPFDPGNMFLLAEAFMDMEEYDLAVGELNKLLLLNPEKRIEAEVHNALGFLWLQKGSLNQADAALKTAIKLEPELALAYHNMAQVAQARKNFPEAEACYRTALEYDAHLSEALVEMGFMQLLQKQSEAAFDSFKDALTVDPFDAQAHLGLSKLAQRNKETSLQIEHALKAFELDPRHSEVNNNLGIAYECRGDLDEAEEAYLRALEINDMNAAAANNLGYLYERKMKQFPERSDHYREGAIEAWKQRLSICQKQNRSTKAATTHLQKLGITNKEIETSNAG